MMRAGRFFSGAAFAAVAFVAAQAGATELKVLSVDAMKPALQALAPDFEKASKDKLKIDYANEAAVEKKITDEEEYDVVIIDADAVKKFSSAAKLAGGLIKPVAKHGGKTYEIATTNWTQHPLDCQSLIDFLTKPKAAEVFKAKGLAG
ncbi:MAG: substrate-binding domain-containing protein [Thiohalocapsa sp.]